MELKSIPVMVFTVTGIFVSFRGKYRKNLRLCAAYGFELYKNGELTDSCWGFLGPLEEAKATMADYLPEECKAMIGDLEEQNHPATIIKTLLKHAKLQIEQAGKKQERTPRQQAVEI